MPVGGFKTGAQLGKELHTWNDLSKLWSHGRLFDDHTLINSS
jgi:hypothetical protein